VNRRFSFLAIAAAALGVAVSALAGTTGSGTIVFGLHVNGKPERALTVHPDGSGRRVLPLPQPVCADCLQISRDGTTLLTAANDGKRITTAVERLDGSGYKAFRLPGPTLNLGPGAWSPNGRRIAFEGWDASGDANGVYMGSATDGTGLRRLTRSPAGSHDVPMLYSPDSSWIVFVRAKSGDDENPADLYAVHANGTGLRKLNPAGTGVRWNFGSPASWAADSGTVAFAAFDLRSGDGGSSAVFTVTPRGAHLHRITPWGEWTTSARFSPDGRWIAFDRLPGHDLLRMRPDGSDVRTIVSAGVDGLGSCCAQWSPDGTHLVFQRGGEPATTLWTVNVDGTGLKEISKTAGEYPSYAWVP
jgi:tricorn protease-like protein